VLAILGIVVSGFALGAVKITSAPAFERMLRDYASVSDDEAAALRAYWGAEYGVAFPPPVARRLRRSSPRARRCPGGVRRLP